MTNALKKTTKAGTPAEINCRATSNAAPEKMSSDMMNPLTGGMWVCTTAIPEIIPNGTTPRRMGSKALTPDMNSPRGIGIVRKQPFTYQLFGYLT
jgi:hypothetical protein